MAVKTKQLNLVVSPDEMDDIVRLADAAGVSRSEIIRKSLKIVFNFIAREKPLIEKEIREGLLKGRKLSVEELTKQREIMLERELNRMAYGEILKATKNEKK